MRSIDGIRSPPGISARNKRHESQANGAFGDALDVEESALSASRPPITAGSVSAISILTLQDEAEIEQHTDKHTYSYVTKLLGALADLQLGLLAGGDLAGEFDKLSALYEVQTVPENDELRAALQAVRLRVRIELERHARRGHSAP